MENYGIFLIMGNAGLRAYTVEALHFQGLGALGPKPQTSSAGDLRNYRNQADHRRTSQTKTHIEK